MKFSALAFLSLASFTYAAEEADVNLAWGEILKFDD